jgi:hypothetical protein
MSFANPTYGSASDLPCSIVAHLFRIRLNEQFMLGAHNYAKKKIDSGTFGCSEAANDSEERMAA